MRNLCCKCKHYYSVQSYDGDYDWGCRVFGSECHRCPSFWDDEGDADETEMGCNVHPKRMDFLLKQQRRKIESSLKDITYKKRGCHHTSSIKQEKGYKAYDKNGRWLGYYVNNYYPNMKGRHFNRRIMEE